MRLVLWVMTDIGEGLSDVREVELPDGEGWEDELRDKVLEAVDSAWREAEGK